MSKVDWSLAPKDAQYGGIYEGKFSCWYMRDGDQWFYSSNISGAWEKVYDNKPSSELIPRPQPKPWSGPEDGLPPVNTECWVETDCGVWEHGVILAHGFDDFKPHAVAQCASGLWMEEVNGFRAIRTPEQLAAEDRDRAIGEISDVISNATGRAGQTVNDISRALYDAGFKR